MVSFTQKQQHLTKLDVVAFAYCKMAGLSFQLPDSSLYGISGGPHVVSDSGKCR